MTLENNDMDKKHDNSDDNSSQVSNKNESDNSQEIWDIKCTLATIWLIWFCIFAAYNPLELLQTSLNPEIGIYSISLIYASTLITSLLAPAIIMKITPKRMIIIGCLGHTSLVWANYYPSWFTLLPAGLVVGLITAPFWTCYSSYLTALSVRYAKLTDQTKVAVLSKTIAYVSTAFPIASFCANFISSSILKYVTFDSDDAAQTHTSDILQHSASTTLDITGELQSNDLTDLVNFTVHSSTINPTMNNSLYNDQNYLNITNCGPNYCPTLGDETRISPEKPHIYTIYVLVSVMACFNLCGVLLAMFVLKNLPKEDLEYQADVKTDIQGRCGGVVKYFKKMFDWRIILLGPGLAYLHFEHSLYSGMFPKAYITCSVGIDWVGYIQMVHALTNLVVHPISGWLGQYIHRHILLLFSYILVVIKIIMWLQWQHLPNEMFALFSIAIVSGVAGPNNNIHLHAFVGDIFSYKKVEAFSFLHFLSGFITGLGFLAIRYICVKTQLFLQLGFMLIGLVSYIIVNIHIKITSSNNNDNTYKILPQNDDNEMNKMKSLIKNDNEYANSEDSN